MPVKIRLTRMGKKKQPSYRVVVMDSRKPRDGKYIEQIGRYDPRQEPSLVQIDNDRAVDWLRQGAQPTERARKLLEISGAWTQFRVIRGDIHTVDDGVDPGEPEPVVLDADSGASTAPEVVSEDSGEQGSEDAAAPELVGNAADTEVEDAAAEELVADAADSEDASESEGTETA